MSKNKNIIKFGSYMADLRIKSGYENQRKLALASGVSTTTICRVESGNQMPKPQTLKKLAPFLNAPFEELMREAGYFPEYITDKKEEDVDMQLKTDQELESFIRKSKIHFHGEPLDEEDKEDIINFLRMVMKRKKK